MLRTSVLIVSIINGVFAADASPIVKKAKKNKNDALIPHFNLFGFTDLDVMDFMTGAAERGYGRDVRENWNTCFKVLTIGDEWQRF